VAPPRLTTLSRYMFMLADNLVTSPISMEIPRRGSGKLPSVFKSKGLCRDVETPRSTYTKWSNKRWYLRIVDLDYSYR
jgi:hypothetical protein